MCICIYSTVQYTVYSKYVQRVQCSAVHAYTREVMLYAIASALRRAV